MCKFLRLLTCVVVVMWMLSTPTVAFAEIDFEDVDENLQSDDEDDRFDAYRELRSEGRPPFAYVGRLLHHARVEADVKAFGELLITLGATGVPEARPIIEAHLESPDEDLREAAHEGLVEWLRVNREIGPDESIPEPDGPWSPAPGFEEDERMSRVPLIVGGATLGGVWVVSALLGAVASLGAEKGQGLGLMAIPVAGPFIVIGERPRVRESGDLLGITLGLGIVQVLGLATMPLSAAFSDTTVVRVGPQQASVTTRF